MPDAHGRTRDLDAWLAPFLAVLGRKTRRVWAPLYLRGLLGPGERESLQPKQGTLSVGVVRQYCGQLGKRANCKSLVWLTLAQGEVPVPVGLRLLLPEEWTGDAARAVRAGVPGAAMTPRSKGGIALAELDRLLAAGVRFASVLADAGYGTSAGFRNGLGFPRSGGH